MDGSMKEINLDLEYLDTLSYILDRMEVSASTDSAIAGGAIRDMLLQKPVSDIDVFYTGVLIETRLNIHFDSVETLTDYGYPDGFTVTHKVKVKGLPVPIQLIKVGDVDAHIDLFPSELIRVSYRNSTGLQGLTPSFIDLARLQHFWWDKEVDLKYFSKIKAKYPDWKHMFVEESFNPEKVQPVELDF